MQEDCNRKIIIDAYMPTPFSNMRNRPKICSCIFRCIYKRQLCNIDCKRFSFTKSDKKEFPNVHDFDAFNIYIFTCVTYSLVFKYNDQLINAFDSIRHSAIQCDLFIDRVKIKIKIVVFDSDYMMDNMCDIRIMRKYVYMYAINTTK